MSLRVRLVVVIALVASTFVFASPSHAAPSVRVNGWAEAPSAVTWNGSGCIDVPITYRFDASLTGGGIHDQLHSASMGVVVAGPSLNGETLSGARNVFHRADSRNSLDTGELSTSVRLCSLAPGRFTVSPTVEVLWVRDEHTSPFSLSNQKTTVSLPTTEFQFKPAASSTRLHVSTTTVKAGGKVNVQAVTDWYSESNGGWFQTKYARVAFDQQNPRTGRWETIHTTMSGTTVTFTYWGGTTRLRARTLGERSALSVIDASTSRTATISEPVRPKNKRKFKSCAALRKVFKNGVAKSKKAVKKQVKRGFRKPKRKKQIYKANKRLDRDRDGTVCERRK